MDVLKDITTKAIYDATDFKITVKSAKDSWMYLDIFTPEYSFGYNACNIVNPLNDLFRDSILIMTKKPVKNSIDYWYGCTIAEHQLENKENVLWMFNLVNDVLYLYIWKNKDVELLEDLYYCGFDSEKYYINSQQAVPDMNEGLILALQVSPTIFAEILIQTYLQMEKDFDNEDREEWGFDYSKNYMSLLSYFVKTNSDASVDLLAV